MAEQQNVSNKPEAVFGLPSFSKPKTQRVFQNKGGGMSAMVAQVTLPLLAAPNFVVEASIWARTFKTQDSDGTDIGPALPRGVTASTDDAQTAFEIYVSAYAQKWPQYQAAKDAALALLNGGRMTKAGREIVLKPRLVKPGEQGNGA